MDAYDLIIIGTGAGGGTLARHLAPSGKRILLLERGDWLKREPANWSTEAVFVDNRYVSPDTWYDKGGKAFQPGVHYFVGGATKLYGAALYRLRKEDFGELRHHDGISPAWPVSYDEFEPYYTLAEQLYQVHGARGEDPTEPPASGPYPHPPVSHEPRIQQLADQLEAAGHRPFHAPCGIMLDESNMPFSRCVRCSQCDGFPCLVHAKSDAEVLGVRPALEHSNVTLLTNRKVVRLDTNDAGNAVTEVVADHDGSEERYSADVVVVSAGAANSAKILLLSANDKHPNGLANGSDQVGRNYMFHDSTAVLALSRDENPTTYQKTLGLNDFYFGADDFEYPLGNVQMVGKSQAAMFRGERPGETKLAPEWTLERDGQARDRLLALDRGPAAARQPGDGERRREHRPELHGDEQPRRRSGSTRKVKSLLGKLDMNPDHLIHRFAYMKNDIPIAGCAHQAGTCRFGTDPGDLRAGHRLPRARGRQPLRGRHELLPEHRCGQPRPDGDGQRAQGRRPPARTARSDDGGRVSAVEDGRPRRYDGQPGLARSSRRPRSTTSCSSR
jgi:choline dehydrogenase-like flavoprotein